MCAVGGTAGACALGRTTAARAAGRTAAACGTGCTSGTSFTPGGKPPFPLRAAIAGSARRRAAIVKPANSPYRIKPEGRATRRANFVYFIAISKKSLRCMIRPTTA